MAYNAGNNGGDGNSSVREQKKANLKHFLWPQHKALLLDDIDTCKKQTQYSQRQVSLLKVEILLVEFSTATNEILKMEDAEDTFINCIPARRFLHSELLFTSLKPYIDKRAYRNELFFNWIYFYKAIEKLRENQRKDTATLVNIKSDVRRTFDDVCNIILKNVDSTSHRAFKRDYTLLFFSQCSVARERMDVCVAGALATAAASAVSLYVQPNGGSEMSLRTVGGVLADVAPVIGLTLRHAFSGARLNARDVLFRFVSAIFGVIGQILRTPVNHHIISRTGMSRGHFFLEVWF